MTTSNVLEILPKSWMLYLVILLVTLQLCLSSAVGNSALFQHLEDFCGAPTHFSYKRCLIRSGLVFLAVLIGELLPKFDLVMSLIGGTLNGTLIFIMPPLFYTKIMKMEEVYDKNERNKQLVERSSDEEISSNVEANLKKKYSSYGALCSPVPQQSIDYKLLGVRSNKSQIVKNWFKNLWFKMQSDCILSLAVVVFGIGATLASTYYNVFQMDSFENLWSPCISNLSYSFQFINS
jgi:solute carrier family 32 (vesicular inhibitory amino acid transporter)